MHETYERWKDDAYRLIDEFTRNSIEAHRVEIDLHEFIKWAKENNYKFDGHARAEFASQKLAERLMRPDPESYETPSSKELKKISQLLRGHDLSEVWEPYLRRPNAAVCPILRENKDGKLQQFGSGVLIQIGEAGILLSAGHVLDEDSIWIPGREKFLSVYGLKGGTRLPASASRVDDRYDVGYIRLHPDLMSEMHKDLLFLGPEDCDLEDITTQGNVYSLVGYPAKKFRAENGVIMTSLLTFSGEGMQDHYFDLLARRPEAHIIIRHRRNRAIQFSTGYRAQPPGPEGMSGGGVFAWSKELPKLSALRQPLLSGIITDYYPQHNVFVATRLSYFMMAIRQHNLDLPIVPHE